MRPRDPQLRVNLGASYLAVGDTERASEEFGRALEANPKLVSALRNLGTLYLKTRRFEGAIDLLEQARAIDPDHVNTLRKLALAFYEMGNETLAEAHMRRALELEERARERAASRARKPETKPGEGPDAG
jgi:tetratricopeptide (TPR) repeat protein